MLENEDFSEWKNTQLRESILTGLFPEHLLGPRNDFQFSETIETEHSLIHGYVALMRALIRTRECEPYFRRYPFKNLDITRESHLSTCCELFFSRVYQFEASWVAQIKRLDRKTRPKGLPIKKIQAEFRDRFKSIIDARNEVHHVTPYADEKLNALGITDLLSSNADDLDWVRMSQSNYRRICRDWVAKVQAVCVQLELYVGQIASLMLQRCQFLYSSKAMENGTLTK